MVGVLLWKPRESRGKRLLCFVFVFCLSSCLCNTKPSRAELLTHPLTPSLNHTPQCSALRKNGFVMIKDRPCKIVDMSTSKTGKHGHAKVC